MTTRHIGRRQRPLAAPPAPWHLGLVLALLIVALSAGITARAATAPDFAATDLVTGATVSVDSLRGEVVLLNTWATWCTPCKAEMPALQALATEFGADGLRVIGVSIDRAGSEDRIRSFAAEAGATFDLWLDPGNTFARTFRTTGVPETLLIGRDGTVLHTWKGPLTEDGADRQVIADAVAGTLAPATPGVIAPGLMLPLAFGAGVLSFLSPCFLPLVPTYAAVFTGFGLRDLTGRDGGGSISAAAPSRAVRRRVVITGLAFVAGFSLVFVMLGASATVVAGWLLEYRVWLMRLGGVLLALLGLHLLGVFRFAFAQRSFQLPVSGERTGPAGAFLIGLAFGAGWTPCIGPILGSILLVAAATASVGQGMLLLAVYAAGLAIPFLAATLLLDRFLLASRSRGAWLPWLERGSGILVLIVAALLMTGTLDQLATLLA